MYRSARNPNAPMREDEMWEDEYTLQKNTSNPSYSINEGRTHTYERVHASDAREYHIFVWDINSITGKTCIGHCSIPFAALWNLQTGARHRA